MRELRARAERIARVLVDDLGLVPGNRVLLHGYNDPQLIACWFGDPARRRGGGGDDADAACRRAREGDRPRAGQPRARGRPAGRRGRGGRRRCASSVTFDELAARAEAPRRPRAGRDLARRRRPDRVHLRDDRRAEGLRALPPRRARDLRHVRPQDPRPLAGGRLHRNGPAGVHVRARRARPVPDALRGVVRPDRDAGHGPAGGDRPPARRHDARDRADHVPRAAARESGSRLPARLHLRRRAASGRRRAGLARTDRHPHRRRHRLDRDAAHLHRRARGALEVRLGGHAGARLRGEGGRHGHATAPGGGGGAPRSTRPDRLPLSRRSAADASTSSTAGTSRATRSASTRTATSGSRPATTT